MSIKNELIDPEKWVDSYGDALYNYALIRIDDKHVAEELVQDTFVAALVGRGSFQGKSTIKTWLYSILKNKIADHLRRKYREKSSSLEDYSENYLDDFFDDRGEWLVKPTKWKDAPQQNFEQQEFLGVVRQCLERLPQKQNDAFRMREFDETGSEEICKVLGISSTNYWVLMHRARLVVRKCLENNWFLSS